MSNRTGTLALGLLVFAAATLAAPLSAKADTVSMKLTGVAGATMGGVYTSPYTALVGPAGLTSASQFTATNSHSISIYCDDFLTEVGVGHIWQANVTSLGDLAGLTSPLASLKFDTTTSALTQQQDYMAEAYLAEEISGLDQTTSAGKTEAGQLSFAMWSIFDPASLNNLSATNKTQAGDYRDAAYTATKADTPTDFSNVYIYTPDPLSSSQEYLAITPVPEPATLSLLAVGLLGLGFAFRRRGKVRASSAA